MVGTRVYSKRYQLLGRIVGPVSYGPGQCPKLDIKWDNGTFSIEDWDELEASKMKVHKLIFPNINKLGMELNSNAYAACDRACYMGEKPL